MLVLEVTNAAGEAKEFQVEESIQEITLGKFVRFQNDVAITKPASLSAYEEADESGREELLKDIDVDQITSDWRNYFIAVVAFWTQLEEKWISALTEEEVIFVYNLINGHVFNYKPDESKDSFTLNSTGYYFPSSPISAFSKQKEYMKGTRVIDSIEAMQFEMYYKQLGPTKWSVLPHIIALLCKRQGEQLPLKQTEREEWIQERATLMEALPLSDALNLAFFLRRRNSIWIRDFALYSILQSQGLQVPEGFNFGKNTVGLRVLNKSLQVNSSWWTATLQWIARKWSSVTKPLNGWRFRTTKTSIQTVSSSNG